MKNLCLFVLASVVGVASLRAADAPGYAPESRAAFEVFTSKVVKTYSFQDGGFEYVAYVVNWKDHEVVVSPVGMTDEVKRYQVGDTVRCQMQQTSLKQGDVTKGRMTFSVFMSGVPAQFGSDAASELRRVEAVADEVARRRAIREAAATNAPAKTKEPKPAAEPETNRP